MSIELNNQGLKEVSVLFNELFTEVLGHHLNLYNHNEEEFNRFRNDVVGLLLNTNPLSVLQANHIGRIFSIYNDNLPMRDFLNRLHFKLLTRVDDVTYYNIIVRMSRALTMKVDDKATGMTFFRRGDKPIGISQEIMNEMQTTTDIHTTLINNPFLVVLLMCLTYVDLETFFVNQRQQQANTLPRR